MTLSRDSRFVRWCYLFSDIGPPFRTSLCVLFWRGFVWTPFALLFFMTLIGGSIGTLAYGMWTDAEFRWRVILVGGVLSTIVASFAFPTFAVSAKRAYTGEPRPLQERSPATAVFVGRVKAWKHKVCPMVELE